MKFLKLSRYDETTPNVETDLNEIKKSGYKIIVILASFNVIQSILNETTSVNSISSNWVWILPTDMMNVLAVSVINYYFSLNIVKVFLAVYPK